MDAEGIISEAQRATGLEVFDSESFREGLELLWGEVGRSRAISDSARAVFGQVAIDFLSNRLRVADYARRHPEVRATPIEQPVIILGLPRTGTTLLSHLLSVDPTRRSLLRWEAFQSAPPPKQGELTTDRRCRAMLEADSSPIQSPSHIHHERADLPVECIITLAHDFKSILWAGMLDVPEYGAWLRECDPTSAYEYHRLNLQVLQAHTGGPWVLKAPAHAAAIDTVFQTYPDARIIWTHRDPYAAIASVCSFESAVRGVHGPVDESRLGPEAVETFVPYIDKPMAVRGRLGQASIYDLHYADLRRNPMREVRRLYDWLGDALSDELDGRMRQWLSEDPQGRFGKHEYSLKRFGVTIEDLRPRFARYVSEYGIELES